ncbi:hypothetical protein ABIE87_006448 [Bradyrhizobium diazoefficiens]|uniref:hypothetical protein n=1 Tax=Bradyrhizobium diazoefficiens TaxID=1355477 RepID=UPI00351531A8
MCDPFTLAASVGMNIAGKMISNNEASGNAAREAAARNAVLQDTLKREQGFADQNATEQGKNLAHYAPGAQGTQLTDAQTARGNTVTGNMTTADANDVPLTADAPAAVRGEIAKRLLSVHDGAVSRAKANANLGGYGDTWLTNSLNTADADRNIGVTNNYANGQKSILSSLQDSAGAAAYKPPSIWSTILGGGSSLLAGKAGAGSGFGAGAGSGGAMGTMQVGSQLFPAFG